MWLSSIGFGRDNKLSLGFGNSSRGITVEIEDWTLFECFLICIFALSNNPFFNPYWYLSNSKMKRNNLQSTVRPQFLALISSFMYLHKILKPIRISYKTCSKSKTCFLSSNIFSWWICSLFKWMAFQRTFMISTRSGLGLRSIWDDGISLLGEMKINLTLALSKANN